MKSDTGQKDYTIRNTSRSQTKNRIKKCNDERKIITF